MKLFIILDVICYCILQVDLLPSPSIAADQPKCGYQNCPKTKPGKLNIHLVPHSHDDVGWLKTVDQYYYGSSQQYQKAGVQYIINSVVNALAENPFRKFVLVEMAFFFKWWKVQNNSTKELVKKLVQNGQLEFINGGWCMNDEATTHYNSIIDQMTLGFSKLEDHFGSCGRPKVGWQIDPFGHSREQASLFSQFNFDGVFFARLDHEDHRKRRNDKTMELVWKGSDDLGQPTEIFTYAMDHHYSPLPGFCIDYVRCGNEQPFVDDPESDDYNIDKLVNNFVNTAISYAKTYSTNNLLVTQGDDFSFQDANADFFNLDKLIKYVNSKQDKVNIFYSTPSCYLYSVYQSNQTFQVKTDDFFPYGSDPHSYWTGYFISRPALKYYERFGNNFLQVVKQLNALTNLNGEKSISYLKEQMGVLQHHDAVTGTEKDHVTKDYQLKLYRAIEKSKHIVNDALKKLIPKSSATNLPTQVFCHSLNISECEITEGNQSIAVTLYNPIGGNVTKYISLPVDGNQNFHVFDPTGKLIKSVVTPISSIVLLIPGRKSKATYQLTFKVDLPPIGYATYLLIQNGQSVKKDQLKSFNKTEKVFQIKGNTLNALFDSSNGEFRGVQFQNGKSVPINASFHYYKGITGNNKDPLHRASGAYVFRPDGKTPNYQGKTLKSLYTENEIFTEVHQQWTPWLGQVIRVYKDQDFVLFDWVVGPIPVTDKIGKEVILKYDSSLKTNATFYTDANGRQLVKRQKDHRDTWKYTVTEPVSGNYYPVNSRIIIQDQQQNIQLTVLTDRSQGGSSISDGSIELMVHRRLLLDDGFGVGEALNESGIDGKGLVIRGQHYLLTSSISDGAKLHRHLSQQLFLQPSITFANFKTKEDYYGKYNTLYSCLTASLPPNVHLLTLEEWKNNSILLRLEHYFQKNEDTNLSKPVTVNLKNLFKQFVIENATEMTLGANEKLSQAERLLFKTNHSSKGKIKFNSGLNTKTLQVTLNPMEIKTLIINVKRNF